MSYGQVAHLLRARITKIKSLLGRASKDLMIILVMELAEGTRNYSDTTKVARLGINRLASDVVGSTHFSYVPATAIPAGMIANQLLSMSLTYQ
jgi:hypothetical protein